MDQHKIVKRIDEIIAEFDSRFEAVGVGLARAELAKALAENEDQLAALRAQVEAMRAALEAAPNFGGEPQTVFGHLHREWFDTVRTPALAGTTPAQPANVATLVEAARNALSHRDGVDGCLGVDYCECWRCTLRAALAAYEARQK